MNIKNEKGVALILSVLVVTILAVVILDFNRSQQVILSVAENRLNRIKAYYLAKSGVKIASLILNEDDSTCDTLDDEWSRAFPPLPFGGGKVNLEIVDEAGKLNINNVKNARGQVRDKEKKKLERLIAALDINMKLAAEIIKGVPFDNIGAVPAGSAADKESIAQFMTVETKAGININTAPREVLISLSEQMTETIADSIIDYRKEQPFKSIPQVKNVEEIDQKLYEDIKGAISVKSDTYHVVSAGAYRNAPVAIEALLKRKGSHGCDILYWRLR